VAALRPSVKAGDPPVARFELFVDGRRHSTCAAGGEMKLDAAKLPAGYHELRVVAIAADSLETQGQCVVPVYCHEVPKLSLTLPPGSKAPWGQPCEIRAEMAGADRIEFRSGGSPVATIAGGKGLATLDTRRLGLGTVLIQPVGFRSAGNGGVSPMPAKPFALTVTPPDTLEGKPAEGKNLVKGLLFRSGERAAVLDAGSLPQALAKISPKPDAPFVLEGYFDVPADDLYQFQLRVKGKASIEVDSVPLHRPETRGWSFMPVRLGRGTHRLKLAVEPGAAATDLDLRFGNQGAQKVAVERFRCLPP